MGRNKKPGGTGRGLPTLGIRLEPEIKSWLEVQAEFSGITAAEYVRDLVRNHKLFVETIQIRTLIKYEDTELVLSPDGRKTFVDAYNLEIEKITEEITALEKTIILEEKRLSESRLKLRQMDEPTNEIIEYYRSEITKLQRIRAYMQRGREREIQDHRSHKFPKTTESNNC